MTFVVVIVISQLINISIHQYINIHCNYDQQVPISTGKHTLIIITRFEHIVSFHHSIQLVCFKMIKMTPLLWVMVMILLYESFVATSG